VSFASGFADLFAGSSDTLDGFLAVIVLALVISIALLYFLTCCSMKATLTSKGQITIPLKIRRRLGLKAGQQLDFDENTPFLKAVKVVDENAWKKARGIGRRRLPATDAEDWLEQTRGPVELPPVRRKR
jgi:AbrB family looped-hinge helix DNA binding protein